MILTDIRQYLRERGEATLEQIALGLKVDQGVVEQAIENWIRKGKVIKVTRDNPCSKAGILSCSCSAIDKDIPIYQWVE